MWKKIAESTDLISYEHRTRSMTTRLEGRLSSDKTWTIFKKYFNDEGISFTEEYHAQTTDEAHYLIDKLKEKILDRQEIEKARRIQKQGIKLQVKRSFKEYNVERWDFSIDNEDYDNFLYIRYEDKISLDISVHARYKIWEGQIQSEIMTILGLVASDLDVKVNIHFYNERRTTQFRGRHSDLFISKIEMGLPDDSE
jgi:hypothetical protein